jgi:hypothetical protein
MKIYDPSLYDLFKAGINFGKKHARNVWTEQEWYDALDVALARTGPPAGKEVAEQGGSRKV